MTLWESNYAKLEDLSFFSFMPISQTSLKKTSRRIEKRKGLVRIDYRKFSKRIVKR
jgi:hypothetical protein